MQSEITVKVKVRNEQELVQSEQKSLPKPKVGSNQNYFDVLIYIYTKRPYKAISLTVSTHLHEFDVNGLSFTMLAKSRIQDNFSAPCV